MNDSQFFLEVAEACARQSTCLRRHYGSVIVDPTTRQIISTGFNGNCIDIAHCDEIGDCPRNSLGIEQYSDYTLCFGIHSEENALIQAGRKANGCVLYLYGFDVVGNREINPKPCFMCTKLLINARISTIFTRNHIYDPYDLYDAYAVEIMNKIKPATFDP